MEIKHIIIRFLDTYSGTLIASHQIQSEIPAFAAKIYGKLVTPETVSRCWRTLRNDKEFLKKNGYSIIEELGHQSKEKRWQIRRLSEVHRDSNRETQQSSQNNTADGS